MAHNELFAYSIGNALIIVRFIYYFGLDYSIGDVHKLQKFFFFSLLSFFLFSFSFLVLRK
jgi:hypothetical protein